MYSPTHGLANRRRARQSAGGIAHDDGVYWGHCRFCLCITHCWFTGSFHTLCAPVSSGPVEQEDHAFCIITAGFTGVPLAAGHLSPNTLRVVRRGYLKTASRNQARYSCWHVCHTDPDSSTVAVKPISRRSGLTIGDISRRVIAGYLLVISVKWQFCCSAIINRQSKRFITLHSDAHPDHV